MKRYMLVVLGMVLTASLSHGQASLENEPGYVDMAMMESWFGDEAFLFVNVKGALLNLVAEASSIEDPDLASLLHRLKAIQVRGFKNEGSSTTDVKRRASGFAKDLDKKGWETIVRVRDDGEHVDLFMKADGDVIRGLMVMVVQDDEDETVFVNIVGDIDPEQIGRLGRKFKIKELERDW